MAGKYDQLGSKLGPRLAHIISQALIHTHKNLAGSKHNLGMALFESMSDQISDEVTASLRPILVQMLDHPDVPGELKTHLDFMANGHGQLKALAGVNLSSAGVLTPIASIITNLLQPVVWGIIGATPHNAPDPGTLGQMIAQGIISQGQASFAMAGQGFDDFWQNALIQYGENFPATGEILDMYRRDLIGESNAYRALTRNGVPVEYRGAMLSLREAILSPADLALAVLRGNMDPGEAQRVAAHNGVSAHDFDILIANTGEPLGLEEMLEAYRRGFIDKARLDRGIRQSRVRNEWIDVAERLRFSPMSTAQAVESVVQSHISPSQGQAIAALNGLQADHFPILVETAGAPLSRTEMNELVNRGLATKADFDQALRESRLKNKYVDKAFALRDRLIPERTLVSMLTHGLIDHGDALTRLRDLGFDQQSAALLVSLGSAQKTTKEKDLAVGSVVALYEFETITRPQAVAMLEKLHYTAEEAEFLLQIADMKRIQRIVNSAITAIRSRYVGRHLTDAATSTALDELGIAATARDQYLAVWAIERSVTVKTLTEAQVHSAVKHQLMPIEAGVQRLVDMGYSVDDATLLLSM